MEGRVVPHKKQGIDQEPYCWRRFPQNRRGGETRRAQSKWTLLNVSFEFDELGEESLMRKRAEERSEAEGVDNSSVEPCPNIVPCSAALHGYFSVPQFFWKCIKENGKVGKFFFLNLLPIVLLVAMCSHNFFSSLDMSLDCWWFLEEIVECK